MDKKKTTLSAEGVKITVTDAGKELGRATLYLMKNDLHDQPFGLLEDVFIDEATRGQGLGSELVQDIIAEAKDRGCYKIIATSRYARSKVHELYEKLGFTDHGKEFRIDF